MQLFWIDLGQAIWYKGGKRFPRYNMSNAHLQFAPFATS